MTEGLESFGQATSSRGAGMGRMIHLASSTRILTSTPRYGMYTPITPTSTTAIPTRSSTLLT